MRSRREKERSRTQDFILVHPSSRAKISPRSVLQDTILLPAVRTAPRRNHTLLNPTVGVKPMQKPLQITSYNYNPL